MGVTQVEKVSCEDCFFHATCFARSRSTSPARPSGPTIPDGLRPPQQMRFVFRQERRRQAAWALPDAQEQAALHA